MLVSVQDVGFGVSQLLPILVEGCRSRRGTLLVQQPELHLHPGLQSRLAELLARLSGPDPSDPHRKQFILETHSEHMILRIQNLVRRGEVRPQDVAILYVDSRHKIPNMQQLRLNDSGDFLDEWPEGFFEERLDELFTED